MIPSFVRIAAAILVLLPAAPAVLAQQGASIQVESPWARATPGASRTTAAYMILRNAGGADRLLSAASPLAETVELHTVVQDGTVMRMRPIAAIDLPAGGAATLQPGGYHVMLIGLRQALKDGDRVPLTLTFEKAGKVAVEATVRPAARRGGHQH